MDVPDPKRKQYFKLTDDQKGKVRDFLGTYFQGLQPGAKSTFDMLLSAICHHFGGIEKRKRESGRTFRSKPLTKEFKQSAEGTFIEILSSLESARFRSIGFDDLFELADKSNQEAMC